MVPSFVGVVLDGALVAGLFTGHFNGRSWCMEMAFDESRRDLGPGQLLLLLAIADAIRRGSRSVNFLQMQGYFKHRWLADDLPVVNVQLIRRVSVHGMKALAGDVRRRRAGREEDELASAADTESEVANQVKRKSVEINTGSRDSVPVSLDEGRAILRGVLVQDLRGLVVLDGPSLEALLPFSVRG
jgi:CelD/BcsL family acetyltransferase involved in cellulose biosynthesis